MNRILGRVSATLGICVIAGLGLGAWMVPSLAQDLERAVPVPEAGPLPVSIPHVGVAREGGDPAAPSAVVLPIETIVQLPPSANVLAFGDTDRDGRNEVILHGWGQFCVMYEIHELQDDGTYVLQYSSVDDFFSPDCNLVAFAAGDTDGDGKMEIIAQQSFTLRVYESPDSTSHPSVRVWESMPISNIFGHSVIGDTDRDGRMEILHSQNFFAGDSSNLYIFENAGDDSMELKCIAPMPGNGATEEKLIGDLDGDGLIEIAVPGLGGVLNILESAANDVWEQTFSVATGLQGAYGIEGPLDTDGDGFEEFLVAGTDTVGAFVTHRTQVYESSGDNVFAVIDSFGQADGTGGGGTNAMGDFNGDGILEYAILGSGHFWVYQPVGDGTWRYLGEFQEPVPFSGHTRLYAFDANKNGKDEIFWQSGTTTSLVLESPETTDVGDAVPGRVRLALWPNPFRGSTVLRVPEALEGALVRIGCRSS